jgi:hypothetical protein
MIADAFRNIARFCFLYFLRSRWAPETESADLGQSLPLSERCVFQ